ncbi:helix-turn-helix transcriptional regulator [Poseidonocella sedimentorum]|uniref:Regulatory protein, luxR family n=1 Tax=Poseidonocella sedimentorum TaxID=871652 RepID=A0A1I6DRZ7_9RHOB|nr:autoinducer binding domain-containing protein [Poseidonocella sedimentorum]SFR08204.1 regulatory protein, luxR family [Poseidonocella sedimentorum]
MKASVDTILEQLEQATALEDMQAVAEALRDRFNVSHVVYHWVSSSGEQYGCGTYSIEWVERYLEKEYLRVDPVITGCYNSFHPVDWKQLDWSGKATRQFQKEAIEYGVGRQGYSIPTRGPNGQYALFTVTDDRSDEEWEEFAEANRRSLIIVAHAMNEKALELEPGREGPPITALSPREVDAITCLALGQSRAQAAQKLSISEHTLRVYIESARHKLGALNTTHAVARAMQRGLIVV